MRSIFSANFQHKLIHSQDARSILRAGLNAVVTDRHYAPDIQSNPNLEIKGQPEHLIRTGIYLELLPNLRHNAKVTADWLTDEIFQRHCPVRAKRLGQTPWLSGMVTIAASILIATPLIWRAAQPTDFQQQMNSTGMPTLLDRMAPTQPDIAK